MAQLSSPGAVCAVAWAFGPVLIYFVGREARISLADYGLEGLARELNRAAAALARRAVEAAEALEPGRPRFVAGSIGPPNRTASISPKVENPAFRAVTFDTLAAAYTDQARGLLEGFGRVLLLTQLVERVAQVRVRGRQIWIQPHRFL